MIILTHLPFEKNYIVYPIIVVLAMFAIRYYLKTAFNKYTNIINFKNITGLQIAQKIFEFYNITDVKLEHSQGITTNYYTPLNRTLHLSDFVYDKSNITAIAIACHEAGYAIQNITNYKPIVIRDVLCQLCRILSKMSIGFMIAGYYFSFGDVFFVGAALFAFVFVFQLSTLFIEINANKISMKAIDASNDFTSEEKQIIKEALKLAAIDYIPFTLKYFNPVISTLRPHVISIIGPFDFLTKTIK